MFTNADAKRAEAYGGMSYVLEEISKDWLHRLPSHVQAMVKCAMKMHKQAEEATKAQREEREAQVKLG